MSARAETPPRAGQAARLERRPCATARDAAPTGPTPGASSDHYQAMADAEGDGLRAAGRTELAHNRGDVELDGMLGDIEA